MKSKLRPLEKAEKPQLMAASICHRIGARQSSEPQSPAASPCTLTLPTLRRLQHMLSDNDIN